MKELWTKKKKKSWPAKAGPARTKRWARNRKPDWLSSTRRRQNIPSEKKKKMGKKIPRLCANPFAQPPATSTSGSVTSAFTRREHGLHISIEQQDQCQSFFLFPPQRIVSPSLFESIVYQENIRAMFKGGPWPRPPGHQSTPLAIAASVASSQSNPDES